MSKNYGTSSFFIFRTPCTTKDSQSTNKIYGWHQQAGFLFMRIICCYILAYWGTFTLIKGMKNVIVIIWLSRYSSRILKTMEKKYKIEYTVKLVQYMKLRSSHPEVFLEKGVLKICSKFTEEHLFLRTLLDGCFCQKYFLWILSLCTICPYDHILSYFSYGNACPPHYALRKLWKKAFCI